MSFTERKEYMNYTMSDAVYELYCTLSDDDQALFDEFVSTVGMGLALCRNNEQMAFATAFFGIENDFREIGTFNLDDPDSVERLIDNVSAYMKFLDEYDDTAALLREGDEQQSCELDYEDDYETLLTADRGYLTEVFKECYEVYAFLQNHGFYDDDDDDDEDFF